MIGTNKKNWQLLDIVDCVETCKQGLVLLVGGLTDEEQNNVATSLTVTWRITIKLLKCYVTFYVYILHPDFITINVWQCTFVTIVSQWITLKL